MASEKLIPASANFKLVCEARENVFLFYLFFLFILRFCNENQNLQGGGGAKDVG